MTELAMVLITLSQGNDAVLICLSPSKDADNDFSQLQSSHIPTVTQNIIIRSIIRHLKFHMPDESKFYPRYYNTMRRETHENGIFRDPTQ